MTVKPIPDGYYTVTPYLIVKGAARALEFYTEAFGATELFRMVSPDGTIGHSEIQIGNSRVMVADEVPAMEYLGPESLGNTPVGILLYVEDVDTRFQKAIAAGGTEIRPVVDQFYGDRSGTLKDPFGHMWSIATRVEDVDREEIQERFKQNPEGH